MNELLDIMYNKLVLELKSEKKFIGESVIISFLKLKSNIRLNYLQRSSVPEESIFEYKEMLKQYEYIKVIGKNNYCLSGKYIWEREREIFNTGDDWIKYLEEKPFYCPKEDVELSDKERVIVFSLILGRAFNKDYSMNLKLGNDIKDKWGEIIEASYKILFKFNIIKTLKEQDLFGKKGNEHKVSHVIRHSDAIFKKNIPFKAPGNQLYYLDLSETGENKIDEVEFSRVVKNIFNRSTILQWDETKELVKMVNEIAHDKGIYSFVENNPFINYSNDLIIQRCFEDMY